MVKDQCFHCKGPGFSPWGTKICMPHGAAKKKKKKRIVNIADFVG